MEYKYSYKEMIMAQGLAGLALKTDDDDFINEVDDLIGQSLADQVDEVYETGACSDEQFKEILKQIIVELQKGAFA